jgi:hypothetical protein
LRAAAKQAEEELRDYSFSIKASYENWAYQYWQGCQQQIRAAQQAQFDLQEQHEEVHVTNALLRRELSEARRENETYKEQLRQHDEASHAAVVGDTTLAELPDKKGSTNQKPTAHITGVSQVGVKRGRGRKGGQGKKGKE